MKNWIVKFLNFLWSLFEPKADAQETPVVEFKPLAQISEPVASVEAVEPPKKESMAVMAKAEDPVAPIAVDPGPSDKEIALAKARAEAAKKEADAAAKRAALRQARLDEERARQEAQRADLESQALDAQAQEAALSAEDLQTRIIEHQSRMQDIENRRKVLRTKQDHARQTLEDIQKFDAEVAEIVDEEVFCAWTNTPGGRLKIWVMKRIKTDIILVDKKEFE